MDVALGVSVVGMSARLALVDVSGSNNVIDQSVVELTGGADDLLETTIAGTHRQLVEGGHRLVATRICWQDADAAGKLRAGLLERGVVGVSLVSAAQAATALTRGVPGHATSALVLVTDDKAALTIVGADATTTSLVAVEPVTAGGAEPACATLMDRLREEPGGAETVVLVDTSATPTLAADLVAQQSPLPIHPLADTMFAIARGAALAGSAHPESTGPTAVSPIDLTPNVVTTAPSPVAGSHLAYSMADADDDSALLGHEADSYVDDGHAVPMQTPMTPLSATPDMAEVEDLVAPAARSRMLLLGSAAAAALVVVGFSATAVSVAVSNRPTTNTVAMRELAESNSGKYLPVLPGQGVKPDDFGPGAGPQKPPQVGGSDVAVPAASDGSSALSFSPWRNNSRIIEEAVDRQSAGAADVPVVSSACAGAIAARPKTDTAKRSATRRWVDETIVGEPFPETTLPIRLSPSTAPCKAVAAIVSRQIASCYTPQLSAVAPRACASGVEVGLMLQ